MNTLVSSLWVEKSDLKNRKWQETSCDNLADGQVLLGIDKYALTANNITYATIGDGFGYWNFFPTGEEGWGIVPVWGFATVLESSHSEISVGERLYGYLPMASHLVVAPTNISGGGFVDGAAHRQGLAVIYNQYNRLGTEVGTHEDERALYQPLFTTSFLIEDSMRKEDWHGAEALVLTSASSKTALGLAMVAKNFSPKVKRIGLTSTGNFDFVSKTGLYDQVLTYDDLTSADDMQSAVVVDFAGNGGLLSEIHGHWNEQLKFSSTVGVTHIDNRSGAGDLVGPKPVLFFAPTVAQALVEEIGAVKFRAKVDEQLSAFISNIGQYLTVEHVTGKDALENAYIEMLGGNVGPDRGLVCAFA